MVSAIFQLLAGLGAFMIGFKLLTDNIEKLFSRSLKKFFSKVQNRFLGVGIGLLTTALLQSSTVTTVMVVGFVNSGIVNLFQATAIIMGANIGSTITAQIVALDSFDFGAYASALAAIGIFMYLLAKNERIKSAGLSVGGFGLIFLALSVMSGSFASFATNGSFVSLLDSINNPFLLLLIGIVLTFLLHSSAALTAIIISMVGAGISIGSGGNSVLYVILGSNIGTCITALITSIGSSTNAKRASFIHLMFNVLAVLIFMIILLAWPSFMENTFQKWFDRPQTQIAMFHTFFNVIATLLFIPFINGFVFMATKIIKDKPVAEEYISKLDDNFVHNPSVALTQITQETERVGRLAIEILDDSINAFVKLDTFAEKNIRDKISHIDELQSNLLDYLVKVAANDLSSHDEKLISCYHSVINDLYREVEIAENMIKYTQKYVDLDLDFSENAFAGILEMKNMLNNQYENISKLILYNDLMVLDDVKKIEDEIDNYRFKMMDDHMKRLEEGKCKLANSTVYINLISNLERAGDHLNYIADRIASEN